MREQATAAGSSRRLRGLAAPGGVDALDVESVQTRDRVCACVRAVLQGLLYVCAAQSNAPAVEECATRARMLRKIYCTL